MKAALIKHHRQSGLEKITYFLIVLESEKTKIRVLFNAVASEELLTGLKAKA